MTINLSLILKKKKTRMEKHFPLSVLVFIDCLVVSASQDAGGHTLSRQNNLTIGIGSHVVGVRTVVRTLRHKQIFSDSLPNFLTLGAPLVRFVRESSATRIKFNNLKFYSYHRSTEISLNKQNNYVDLRPDFNVELLV